ncbi:MAG: aspartate/glutamate racemase family protein [Methyloligellaceae bacterium]
MKTLGLIGGMSWESTILYYRGLNEGVRDRLGGLNSAELLLWSFNFKEIETLQASESWDKATERMVDVARRLEDAGAEGLVICTNTMHKMAGDILEAVKVPLIHIADATANALTKAQCTRPLLLATRYTMEQDFYKGILTDNHGLEAVIPGKSARHAVQQIIYDELCQGIVEPHSKSMMLEIVEDCRNDNIDSVILGCTEIGMLVAQSDFDFPAIDSTLAHIDTALDFALS